MITLTYVLVVAWYATQNRDVADYGIAMQEFGNQKACQVVADSLLQTKRVRFATCYPKQLP